MLKSKFKAFSFIELAVSVTIFAILASVMLVIFDAPRRIAEAQRNRAVFELSQLKLAIQLYSHDHGGYPPDQNRGIDPGLDEYLSFDIDWANGPIPGSVYDYENWIGNTCIDPDVEDSVQISLRQVSGRNPDGSNTWTWYAPATPDKFGGPHCSDPVEWDKGECVTCKGFDIDNPPTF